MLIRACMLNRLNKVRFNICGCYDVQIYQRTLMRSMSLRMILNEDKQLSDILNQGLHIKK